MSRERWMLCCRPACGCIESQIITIKLGSSSPSARSRRMDPLLRCWTKQLSSTRSSSEPQLLDKSTSRSIRQTARRLFGFCGGCKLPLEMHPIPTSTMTRDRHKPGSSPSCWTASRVLKGSTFLNIGNAVTNSPGRCYLVLGVHHSCESGGFSAVWLGERSQAAGTAETHSLCPWDVGVMEHPPVL